VNDHYRRSGSAAIGRPGTGSTAVGCGRGARTRWAWVGAQLSKSGPVSGIRRNRLKRAGLCDLCRSLKITAQSHSFPVFHCPVKATRRSDIKQPFHKKHLYRFCQKNNTVHTPAQQAGVPPSQGNTEAGRPACSSMLPWLGGTPATGGCRTVLPAVVSE
jgi:hypothetical protein